MGYENLILNEDLESDSDNGTLALYNLLIRDCYVYWSNRTRYSSVRSRWILHRRRLLVVVLGNSARKFVIRVARFSTVFVRSSHSRLKMLLICLHSANVIPFTNSTAALLAWLVKDCLAQWVWDDAFQSEESWRRISVWRGMIIRMRMAKGSESFTSGRLVYDYGYKNFRR